MFSNEKIILTMLYPKLHPFVTVLGWTKQEGLVETTALALPCARTTKLAFLRPGTN